MTWKQIEASREIRLWVSQIVVPAAIAVATIMTIPEVRQSIAEKAENIKCSIKQKVHKN